MYIYIYISIICVCACTYILYTLGIHMTLLDVYILSLYISRGFAKQAPTAPWDSDDRKNGGTKASEEHLQTQSKRQHCHDKLFKNRPKIVQKSSKNRNSKKHLS